MDGSHALCSARHSRNLRIGWSQMTIPGASCVVLATYHADMPSRPALTPNLTEREFRRWYWTMAELQPFARSIGVRAAGPKMELTDRIAAQLGGRKPHPSQPRSRSGPQLSGSLSRDTEIPSGQRSTREIRSFFETEIGQSFRFNGHMRAFLLQGGSTLGEAVDHWYRTSGTPLPKQSASLEFNGFTRKWHVAHPEGTATQCRAAWNRYRSLPVDQRPDIAHA